MVILNVIIIEDKSVHSYYENPTQSFFINCLFQRRSLLNNFVDVYLIRDSLLCFTWLPSLLHVQGDVADFLF